jgi:hypothetical protein
VLHTVTVPVQYWQHNSKFVIDPESLDAVIPVRYSSAAVPNGNLCCDPEHPAEVRDALMVFTYLSRRHVPAQRELALRTPDLSPPTLAFINVTDVDPITGLLSVPAATP